MKKLCSKKVSELSTEELLKSLICRGEDEKNPVIAGGCEKLLKQINREVIFVKRGMDNRRQKPFTRKPRQRYEERRPYEDRGQRTSYEDRGPRPPYEERKTRPYEDRQRMRPNYEERGSRPNYKRNRNDSHTPNPSVHTT